jgi:DNA-binding MarR family transcriptional regulator
VKSRTLRRPDRTPQDMASFMRELHDEFVRLGSPVGGAFTLVPGSGTFQLESADQNAPGGARKTDPATSKAARLKNFPQSGTQRFKALVAITQAGTHGLTGHEVAEETGIPYRSITPRLRELQDGGWVEVAEFTRKTDLDADAQVLRVTDRGRRECSQRLGYRKEALPLG